MLVGYRLALHKRSSDGSGKGYAIRTGDQQDVVWGVVFEFDEAEKPHLDRAEALGSGYDEMFVTVRAAGGKSYDAVMYYATDIKPELRPYSWYLRFIVEGAKQHGLPEAYVAMLECVQSIEDPDRDRDRRERAVVC